MFEIVRAENESLLAQARAMFHAYASMPHMAARFSLAQRAAELARLPAPYDKPADAIFLAMQDGKAIGCIGLCGLAHPGEAELKRLYVTPAGRSLGAGRALVECALRVAKGSGVTTVRLDTLPELTGAIRLYQRFGFMPSSPYRDDHVDGAIYFALALTPAE